MATTLIMLGRAWLWGGVALTLLAYAYVWWTEGFWQMEKSGVLSFSNGLEIFLVLAPGILLLILGRHLRARHGLRISEAPSGAEDLNLGSGIMSSDTSLKEVGVQASLRSAPILKLP